MADEHKINAHGLRLVGQYLEDPKQTVADASNKLFVTLGDIGEPWSDDENGLKFAEQYVPARDAVFKTLKDVNDGFDRLQSNIYTTADNYEITEKHNTY